MADRGEKGGGEERETRKTWREAGEKGWMERREEGDNRTSNTISQTLFIYEMETNAF